MKKLIVFLAIIGSSITILFGCTNKKEIKFNTNNVEFKDQNKNDSINSENNVVNKSNKTNIQDNTNSNSSKKNDLLILLKNIKNSAENGKVINSSFKIGQNIDTIIQKLGNPNSKTYVKSAKGTYFTFNSNDISFGCNKGSQVFEIRSFYNNLDRIKISEIKNFFGIPDYELDTQENEKIFGYKINSIYKILFVFNQKSGTLKHYSVFNPSLTKNSMSGDPGREW